jgi:hypothetical protein
MIFDHEGNPVEAEQPKPQPHRFGHFVIPPDARLTLTRGGIDATAEHPYTSNGCYKAFTTIRLKKDA